jgi:hypothetical protein
VKRRLFNLLSAMSLVLCIATVGLWARSHWKFDDFGLNVGNELPFACFSLDGDIQLCFSTGPTRLGGTGWTLGWYAWERNSPQWMSLKALRNLV